MSKSVVRGAPIDAESSRPKSKKCNSAPISTSIAAAIAPPIACSLENRWRAALRRLFEPFFADEHERRVAVADLGRDPLRDVIAAAERMLTSKNTFDLANKGARRS